MGRKINCNSLIKKFETNEERKNESNRVFKDIKQHFIPTIIKDDAVSDIYLKSNIRHRIKQEFQSNGNKKILDNVFNAMKAESLYWKMNK